ncbi:PIN domain-containing protein [Kineococcus arenarius]|uniref:hypothetical protein n=1 Tax=Kineococcus sp. SYSU DK007 TaxID=3383128 RepID=UPI003D7DC56F
MVTTRRRHAPRHLLDPHHDAIRSRSRAASPDPGGRDVLVARALGSRPTAVVGLLTGESAISAAPPAELHPDVLVTTDSATGAERLRRLPVLHRGFDALPPDEAVAAGYGRPAAAVVAAGRQPRAGAADLGAEELAEVVTL